ncbi:MAG TPA: 3-deoxy-D-manno-octulosonic acid transferase [Verrucomicrobiota bacterium]|nr:3-deoxy-D-manno-octulosonic acid transferase [Verrucomicrobiota bacterium]HNU51927.1 3-deoxy-D-manno-octulosonic acid transferase [Verrucomicrobiota bacterium]
MRALYICLFAFFFCLSAPYYFWKMRRRGNWRAGFAQRFGRYESAVKHSVTNRHVLWIHAVSVGEVGLCAQLIRVLEPRVPNIKIVVSTTTSTGMGELHRRLPGHIEKIYYPIDFRGCVSKALAAVHPDVVVLVEAEIWPNFLWKLRDRRTPVFLVNARLSDRSFRGYRWFGFLFRPLFRQFRGVGAQSEADAARLRQLGFRPEAIHVMGSLKFDAAPVDERQLLDVQALLRQIGVPADAPVLLGGSTHDGEEAVLADVYLRLRARHPNLFLILVPRHFERGKEVGRVLSARGISFVYRREITAATRLEPGAVQCLIVNTTGELKFFYQHATAIFVGKSLVGVGGQNPIEPGALGKPMVFGPNMQNFREIAATFVREGGALQVEDAAGLEAALEGLFSDPARCEELGRKARQVVRANTGAIGRTVDMIVAALAEKEGIVIVDPAAD